MKVKGIDVSRYQGKIDWHKVKASGIQFAMLKTVSTNKSFGGIYTDQYFEYNYTMCKTLGIPCGVYYYTYAQNIETANKELAELKRAIEGKQFEYPVVIDVEDNLLKPISKQALTELVEYAVETIESWGYYAQVYTYLNYSNTELDMNRLKAYDLWLACYRAIRPIKPKHNMWQYSSTGKVDGITGNVDLNYAYIDYPSIIKKKGLNGYTEKLKTNSEVAKEVLKGLWSNGKDRKTRLTNAGYSYPEVQAEVNKLLGI